MVVNSFHRQNRNAVNLTLELVPYNCLSTWAKADKAPKLIEGLLHV